MVRENHSPTDCYPCAHNSGPKPRRRGVLGALAAVGAALLGGASSAHLGGFETTEGYAPWLNLVQNYNAGQYGTPCNFGGVQTPITPNTGLWEAISGGFSSGGSLSYASGHFYFDRVFRNTNGASGLSSDQALVLTTGHEGWNGPPLKYKYNLDSCDLGGCEPADTGNSIVTVSFWVCAALPGPELGGQIPDGYFGDEIAFLDSLGNIGFMVGLTQRASGDKVTYWDGTAMVESNIVAASNKYDRWDITLNMATDTVSATYFSFGQNLSFPLVVNAPMMGVGMVDYSAMTFRTSPGVNNAKLMSVDDFVFGTECADCDAVDEEILCALDGSGDFTVTVKVTNNSSVTAERILITPLPPGAPVGVTPNVIEQTVPANGGMHTFDVTFSGLTPDVEFCFVVTLVDDSGNVCCSETVCITPKCECLQVPNETEYIVCAPDGPPGTYLYTFQFDNLTPDTIHHVYFFPPSGVTISPNYVAMTPAVGPNGTSQQIMLMIAGVSAGEEICFEIAIHDEFLNQCCTSEICIVIPECDDHDPRGACCFEEPGVPQPGCVITTAQECQTQYNGVYQGDNTTCNPNPCLPEPGESTVHLTAAARCCWPQDLTTTTTLTICNASTIARNYMWSLAGVVGPGCPVAISSNFISPDMGSVTLLPGECVDIPIEIFCEGTLGGNGMSCLEATVTDLTSNIVYTATGKVTTSQGGAGQPLPPWCVRVADPFDPTVGFELGEEYVTGTFLVTNNTMAPEVLFYTVNGGGSLSVNGQSPGVGTSNFIRVEPGETVPLLFGVTLNEFRPFEVFDAVLFSDLDGDGEEELVISQGYQSETQKGCDGDTNGDNFVDFADLNTVLTCFGDSGDPDNLLGDLNGDGVVNFADLNEVLVNFGRGCN